MKKLMFAAAVACAAVAGFAIESNIVGYQNVPAEATASELKGVMFQNTSGGPILLSSITMSEGTEIETTTLSRFVDGAWVQYTWGETYEADGETPTGRIEWGIFDDENYFVTIALDEDVEIALGEGVLVQAYGDDPQVMLCGQVWQPTENVEKAGRAVEATASLLIANVFPGSSYMLSSITMSDETELETTTLSRFVDGAWVQYTWGETYEADGETPTGRIEWGIFDDENYFVTLALDEDVEIAAGEGLLMQAYGDNPQVLFTNPFYDAAK